MSKIYHTEKQRNLVLELRTNGTTISEIAAKTSVPRSTVYYWIKKAKENEDKGAIASDRAYAEDYREYFKLKEHCEKLESIVEVLHIIRHRQELPKDEEKELMNELYYSGKYSVRALCEAFEIPRGSFYNRLFRGKHGDTVAAKRREEMKSKILTIYHNSHQVYGAQKIFATLKEQGEHVSIAFVRELMKEMGIKSIRIGAKKQYNTSKKKKNVVKRDFTADHPNQVWLSDVTEYMVNGKKYYICFVMDLYARMIVAHKISNRNNTHLTKGTFKIAYETRKPPAGLIFHSDRGSNYCSRTFCNYLKSCGVIQSFSMAGKPHDNAPEERLNNTLKTEWLYRYEMYTETQLRASVDQFVYMYNHERIHETLRNLTPKQKEAAYYSKLPKSGNIRQADDDLPFD